MRCLLRAQGLTRLFGPLILAGLSLLALCLSVTTGGARVALAVSRASGRPTHIAKNLGHSSAANALAMAATSGLPVGGVLGNVDGFSADDILAIDPTGNLWLYPNTGGSDQNMFGNGRSLVGSGWSGYTLAAVAPLFGAYQGGGRIAAQAGILAIDPAGNLWYYRNTFQSGTATFGSPSQVGTGWTGYTVVGLTDLYGTVDSSGTAFTGILAIDPAGNLWYYPGAGGNGFGARSLVGVGWSGYVADVADINGDGSPDILAVDPAGNLWLYPNVGGTGTATFGAPTQVGSGWSGYQAIDVGLLTHGSGGNDILAVDPAGNLYCYPNTGGTGTSIFGAPFQVGSGWGGFRIN